MRGGWFGRGPGEGTVKRILPDSHTDFVFAVAAEEFGIVLCLVLVALFAFIVLRALQHAMRNEDPFTRFAAAGLAILFGLQSAINMAVNLHLMPAKGMTLPFISYGGSSMISLAYGMGMLLALTRERPRAAMLDGRDAHAARVGAGLMADARRSFCSRPAGPAAICFPRRRWPTRWRGAASSVDLATDERASVTAHDFPGARRMSIPSATIRGRDPISLAQDRRRARPRR